MSDATSFKQKFAHGFRWSAAGLVMTQTLYIVTAIVLARLLNPSDYAVAAVALSITTLIQIIFGRSFATAILPKQSNNVSDYHMVFCLYLFFSIISITIVFLGAQAAAVFYKNPSLPLILKVLCVQIFFTLMGYLPRTIMEMRFQFKEISLVVFFSNLAGYLTAIVLAVKGYGYWAVLTPGLLTAVLETVSFFALSRYFPALVFSKEIFRRYASFGVVSTATDVLNTLVSRGDYLILGKIWSPVQLGSYFFAYERSNRPYELIFSKISPLILSTFSALSNEQERFKKAFLEFAKVASYITLPLSVVLLALADKFFPLVFGPQWNTAIILFQVFVCRWFVRLIGIGVSYGLLANGKPKYAFYSSCLRAGVMLPLFLILQMQGAGPFKAAVLVVLFDSLILGLYYLRGLYVMEIPVWEVVRRTFSAAGVSVLMLVAILGWRFYPGYHDWGLAAQLFIPLLLAGAVNLAFMRKEYKNVYGYFRG